MTDNPNVMRSLYTGVVTQLKQKYADHLLDIGGCSLHHLTNGTQKSVKNFIDMKKLRILYKTFTGSFHIMLNSQISSVKLQNSLNVVQHKLLQYCEIRYLCIYPVVVREIEHY